MFYGCVVKVITFSSKEPSGLTIIEHRFSINFYILTVNLVLGNVSKGWYVFVPRAMGKLWRTLAVLSTVWHFLFYFFAIQVRKMLGVSPQQGPSESSRV